MLRPSSRAAWWTRFSTSAAGTSACTRTRDSGSSVTVVVTSGHGGTVTIQTRACDRRFAAWLVCGPLGHLWAGVADWVELLRALAPSTRRRHAAFVIAIRGLRVPRSSCRCTGD